MDPLPAPLPPLSIVDPRPAQPTVVNQSGGSSDGTRQCIVGPIVYNNCYHLTPPAQLDDDLENRFADLRSDVATDRYLGAVDELGQGSDRLQQHLDNVREENKHLKQKKLIAEVDEVVKKGRKHLGLGAPKDEDPSRFTPEYTQELLDWAKKNLPSKK
jgi:hypothetical protein